jgi:hypothetical protein
VINTAMKTGVMNWKLRRCSATTPGTIAKIKLTPGGHEIFTFRNGWLNKGIDATQKDGLAVTKDDTVVTLDGRKIWSDLFGILCSATSLLEGSNSTGQNRQL